MPRTSKKSKQLGNPVLFFTDLHIDKKKYSNRKIGLWEDMSKSLKFVIETAKQYNACSVLFGGDLTDIFDWRVMDIYLLTKMLEDFAPIPTFAAIGNHDVPADEINFLPYTAAGIAYSQANISTSMTRKSSRKGFLIEFIDNFCLICCDWGYFYQLSEFIEENMSLINNNHIVVVSCHHNLADRESEHTYYWKTEPIHKRIDYFFSGDIHNGYGPALHSNKHTVCGNPGAVVRKHIGEANNTPSLFLLYPSREILRVLIPGPTKEELFYFEKDSTEVIENDYNSAIEAAKNAKAVDPKELLEEVALEIGTPQESLDLFLDKITAKDGQIYGK